MRGLGREMVLTLEILVRWGDMDMVLALGIDRAIRDMISWSLFLRPYR